MQVNQPNSCINRISHICRTNTHSDFESMEIKIQYHGSEFIINIDGPEWKTNKQMDEMYEDIKSSEINKINIYITNINCTLNSYKYEFSVKNSFVTVKDYYNTLYWKVPLVSEFRNGLCEIIAKLKSII